MKKPILLLFTLSLVIVLYHAHTSSEDFYPNDMDDDTIVIAILDDGLNLKFKNINDFIYYNDLIPNYPSSFDLDNVLSVTTLNQDLSLWEWSNFGSSNIDIGVVGVNIPTFNTYSGEYELGSGTSISTAILTGYASTILENESSSPATLKQEIIKNAKQMENLKPYINNGNYLHTLKRGVS